MSKVSCTLTSGDGDSDVVGATIEIIGVKSDIIISIPGGYPFPGLSDKKKDIRMNSKITHNSYIAVIPPQHFEKDANFLKITLKSGAEFYYKIPNDEGFRLNEANVYKFDMNVAKSGVTAKSSIEDW